MSKNPFSSILEEATAAATAPGANLQQLRTLYLGRKGRLTLLLREVGNAPPAERSQLGKWGNEAKQVLEALLQEAGDAHDAVEYDFTLPGDIPVLGREHPITTVINEITDIFTSMGFSVATGPEVENDYYNFEALNLGPDHPARDMQDTFYLAGSERNGIFTLLPRTHTSGVQIRTMEKQPPPVRIIAPGRVYRNEAEDATHSAVFHQIEGLMIDTDITFSDLKGILTEVVRRLLGDDVSLRFRPSFFPYTEPSAEVDVSSPRVRDGEWLELTGAGMVHPALLERVGYNPQHVQGFAFGMGPARIAMLKYGIDDLRTFFRPDMRILEQL